MMYYVLLEGLYQVVGAPSAMEKKLSFFLFVFSAKQVKHLGKVSALLVSFQCEHITLHTTK